MKYRRYVIRDDETRRTHTARAKNRTTLRRRFPEAKYTVMKVVKP